MEWLQLTSVSFQTQQTKHISSYSIFGWTNHSISKFIYVTQKFQGKITLEYVRNKWWWLIQLTSIFFFSPAADSSQCPMLHMPMWSEVGIPAARTHSVFNMQNYFNCIRWKSNDFTFKLYLHRVSEGTLWMRVCRTGARPLEAKRSALGNFRTLPSHLSYNVSANY